MEKDVRKENLVEELDCKCKCCWASDKVCEYCYYYEYYKGTHRCSWSGKIVPPKDYCTHFTKC